MPLHRDILWIGRHWVVTGYGMQAINQKYNGQFDIPVERLWADDLPGEASAQKWFDADDFIKGLAVARTRHAGPSRMPAAPLKVIERQSPSSPVEAEPASAPLPEHSTVHSPVQPPKIVASAAPAEVEFTGPRSALAPFELGIPGHRGRLARVWRVHLK